MSRRPGQRRPADDYRASLTPRQREILDDLVTRAVADVVIPWWERHPQALEELREAGEASEAREEEAA